ncbi:MAG: hypothetical protein AVDCRST_MAG19-17, partial [uncultured Thermomicrobiales bacterium]
WTGPPRRTSGSRSSTRTFAGSWISGGCGRSQARHGTMLSSSADLSASCVARWIAARLGSTPITTGVTAGSGVPSFPTSRSSPCRLAERYAEATVGWGSPTP